MSTLTMRRRSAAALLTLTLGLLSTSRPVAAQGAFEPRIVEFLPGRAAVAATTAYALEIAAAGSGALLQRVTVGMPPVDGDGMMRLDVAAHLRTAPAAGVAYTARIVAVGPAGTTVSAASAPFTFGAATATATPTAAPQTVHVASAAALDAAVATLTSNTTLVLAPGTYRLATTLAVTGPLTGVTLRGATGRASDVVLEGAGVTATTGARTAIAVTGRVDGLQIADLSIRQFAAHAVTVAAGAQAPRLSNLRLSDTGNALVTVAAGVDAGIVEHVSFASTTLGLRLQGVRGWTVRLNAFRGLTGIGVAASDGSSDTVVTQNLFADCGRAIAFGLTDVADGVDHRGGRITSNFITRAATVAGGAGISLIDAAGTVVAHNTVLTAQTAAPIAYRFADSVDLLVANNLTDGPLQARDGAWAVETGNVTTATADLFVDAAAGDLHLRATAAAALDIADASVAARLVDAADIDGVTRGQAPDAGADEVTN